MAKLGAAKTVAQMLVDAAAQDLAACTLLSSGVGIGDAVVGFHAQQAVEKSIKAVLSARGIEFRPRCRPVLIGLTNSTPMLWKRGMAPSTPKVWIAAGSPASWRRSLHGPSSTWNKR